MDFQEAGTEPATYREHRLKKYVANAMNAVFSERRKNHEIITIQPP